MLKLPHASKVCSKFSKPGFSNTWTVNFQMFKLVLEKAEEPEIKLPTSIGSSKKQESSRKTSTSALLTMPKPLTVWITTNCGKFFKRWEYHTTWPASWAICQEATVRTGHGTTDWFQIGQGVCQGCILSPCLFNLYEEYIMRNAGLDEAQAGIKIAGRWRRKWQPTPVFFPGESQGWRSLVSCHLWAHTESDDWSNLAVAAAMPQSENIGH